MPPARDPSTWLLHVTSPLDRCKWLLCSSTQFLELSQLNTFSRFCQKHNFFEAPKIRNINTWHITWLLPFTLSIFFDQPRVFVTRLTVLQKVSVWKNLEKVLNQLNSASWAEKRLFEKSYKVQRFLFD